MRTKEFHASITKQIGQLYFRQSFLKDYLVCPQMSLYRWILQIEETEPFFAAVLGSAGHAVIYEMHKVKKFDYTYIELNTLFNAAFDAEIAKLKTLPKLGTKYENIEEQRDAMAHDYVAMLTGYQQHTTNRDFMSTIHEQSFVLTVSDDTHPDLPPALFTGTIDQAGYYPNGTFVMRDIKFRDSHFRPCRTALDLDHQMTIYCTALKFGNPSCRDCAPKYITHNPLEPNTQTLYYAGPCQTCFEKIDTIYWPRKYAERAEMVWMRDFDRYKKDQYAKTIKDPTAPKVRSPKSNRMVIAERPNPDYDSGYKIGDYRGPCFLPTYRTPASIDVLMSDVLRLCQEIRKAAFYRKPGEHCESWCRYNKQCRQGIESEIKEIDLAAAQSYATLDPF